MHLPPIAHVDVGLYPLSALEIDHPLDATGEAWVELPDWFEALNESFRYQLTPIGAPEEMGIGFREGKEPGQ